MSELALNSSALVIDGPFIFNTLIQLALAFLMATILRGLYIRFGTSISNRKAFSINFFLLAMTITFIIAIVKSSLALSLGLVGALSIVRFRSAIKEPEELAYLFITIAIGIGLGAGQIVLTCVAFAIIAVAIVLTGMLRKPHQFASNSNLSLIFRNQKRLPQIDQVINAIKPHCKKYLVRRYHKHEDMFDVGILVEFVSEASIENVRNALLKLDKSVEIQFVNPQDLAM